MSENKEEAQHYYRLKVNINGFKLEDIKVELDDVTKPGKENAAKARVKISAKRSAQSESHEKGHESESVSKEYTKFHDLSAATLKQYGIELGSMRHYLDGKNPAYLVVEFRSHENSNECGAYVTLDDSCESLVELAARSLLNVKSLENLREVIQDPFKNKLKQELVDMFSPTLIRDLSLATNTTFTPIKIDSDQSGKQKFAHKKTLFQILSHLTQC